MRKIEKNSLVRGSLLVGRQGRFSPINPTLILCLQAQTTHDTALEGMESRLGVQKSSHRKSSQCGYKEGKRLYGISKPCLGRNAEVYPFHKGDSTLDDRSSEKCSPDCTQPLTLTTQLCDTVCNMQYHYELSLTS